VGEVVASGRLATTVPVTEIGDVARLVLAPARPGRRRRCR